MAYGSTHGAKRRHDGITLTSLICRHDSSVTEPVRIECNFSAKSITIGCSGDFNILSEQFRAENAFPVSHEDQSLYFSQRVKRQETVHRQMHNIAGGIINCVRRYQNLFI